MCRKIIATICAVVLLVIARDVRADGDPVDTVFMTNGGRIRGAVIVDDAKEGITIRALDGKVRSLKRSEVMRIEYAAAAPLTVAPVTQQAPVAPPTADDAVHAQPTTRVERSSLKVVWVSGLVMDLSVWLLRAGITFATCASYPSTARGCNGQDWGGAAIPVIGAWIQVSKGVGGDQGNTPEGFGGLVGAGIIEAIGFTLFVIGLSVHRDVTVPVTDVSLVVGPVRFRPTVTLRSVGIVGSF